MNRKPKTKTSSAGSIKGKIDLNNRESYKEKKFNKSNNNQIIKYMKSNKIRSIKQIKYNNLGKILTK